MTSSPPDILLIDDDQIACEDMTEFIVPKTDARR